MVVPIGNAFRLVGTIKNLFDAQYADPTADLRQDAIVQNGRTLRVGVSWKFRSN